MICKVELHMSIPGLLSSVDHLAARCSNGSVEDSLPANLPILPLLAFLTIVLGLEVHSAKKNFWIRTYQMGVLKSILVEPTPKSIVYFHMIPEASKKHRTCLFSRHFLTLMVSHRLISFVRRIHGSIPPDVLFQLCISY